MALPLGPEMEYSRSALPESLEPDGLAPLLSTDYKFAVSFVILLIVLLFKPTGLFKGKAV